jgi:rhodanese-related sulfurtransferase
MLRSEQLGPTIVLGAAVLFLTGCQKQVTDRDIEAITLDETRTLYALQRRSPDRKIVVFIDPRASRDFEKGHIPGARNLHLPKFKRRGGRDPELEAYENIVVYGENPGDLFAPGVVKRLLELGYDGVRFFAGGLAAWSRVYSVESSAPEQSPDPGDSPALEAPSDPPASGG